jgi:hypothetical protein
LQLLGLFVWIFRARSFSVFFVACFFVKSCRRRSSSFDDFAHFFVTALFVEGIRVFLFVRSSFFCCFSLFALKVSWRRETDLLSSFSSAVLIAYEGRTPGLSTTAVFSFFPCHCLFRNCKKKCSPRSAEECRKQGRIGSYQAADDDDVFVFSDANPLS